jgi:rhodanese-related sulfurtransferase
VADRLARDEIVLVDVREPYEVEAGRIDGAVHVGLMELQAAAQQLPQDRPLVFYCRVGARSAMATQAFVRGGWDAYNMTGGIEAWVAAGLPLTPEGGYVAPH